MGNMGSTRRNVSDEQRKLREGLKNQLNQPRMTDPANHVYGLCCALNEAEKNENLLLLKTILERNNIQSKRLLLAIAYYGSQDEDIKTPWVLLVQWIKNRELKFLPAEWDSASTVSEEDMRAFTADLNENHGASTIATALALGMETDDDNDADNFLGLVGEEPWQIPYGSIDWYVPRSSSGETRLMGVLDHMIVMRTERILALCLDKIPCEYLFCQATNKGETTKISQEKMHKFEKAFNTACDLEPDLWHKAWVDFLVQLNYARYLVRQGDTPPSKKLIDLADDANGEGQYDAFYKLGRFFQDGGDNEHAIYCYKSVSEKCTDHEEARRRLVELQSIDDVSGPDFEAKADGIKSEFFSLPSSTSSSDGKEEKQSNTTLDPRP